MSRYRWLLYIMVEPRSSPTDSRGRSTACLRTIPTSPGPSQA